MRAETTAASRVAVRANSHRIAAATIATTTCTAIPVTRMWSCARPPSGARDTRRSSTSCAANAQVWATTRTVASRPNRSVRSPVRANARTTTAAIPATTQHQDGLVERGEVRVARALQGERALMGVGDRDQVRERVPEHQPGRGRAEDREASEPGSFTHAD